MIVPGPTINAPAAGPAILAVPTALAMADDPVPANASAVTAALVVSKRKYAKRWYRDCRLATINWRQYHVISSWQAIF